MLKFKKLFPHAQIPYRANPGDAGFDLFAAEEVKVYPEDIVLIRTGIACEIPEGFVGLVCPRSGLANKVGATIVNAPGIIDSSYRGEIKVIFTRIHTEISYTVEIGDKIAQLVVVPCLSGPALEVDELSPTIRGADGFGSTGR